MLAWVRSLVDRVKVLLVVRAVQEREAEVLAAGATRGDGLRRLAAGCEAEGLAEVAADLRRKAAALDRDWAGSEDPARAADDAVPAIPPAGGPRRGRGR